jgi:hypothetical protein
MRGSASRTVSFYLLIAGSGQTSSYKQIDFGRKRRLSSLGDVLTLLEVKRDHVNLFGIISFGETKQPERRI